MAASLVSLSMLSHFSLRSSRWFVVTSMGCCVFDRVRCLRIDMPSTQDTGREDGGKSGAATYHVALVIYGAIVDALAVTSREMLARLTLHLIARMGQTA
mmetsp:Transcript_111294/g.359267  ORF Transcript_111294/g.359267 Transcript_111294/m.359267 type:complete len:99 (+) Transcript_111294:2387-2683(+)